MKIKHIAGGAFLLNTLLFGSYYAISKEVLGRVDPIVFSFCEMMTLVPPALIILAYSWRQMTRQAVKSGFVLGSCLCLGLFMLSVALRYNTATGTAFFPALNGLLAALFTWVFLRQPITKVTWIAAIVSVIGAFLLMANADMGGIRGGLIAFIGGLFCTMYIFLADQEQKNQTAHWPLFAIELLTMALWGNLIALLFGDWNMTHFELPKDALVILYIGLGTVFLPTLITLLLQKHISPVTVSFITILEPILSAIIAYLYLHEVLPLNSYLGGGLIVAGVFIHTWGSRERSRQTAQRQGLGQTEALQGLAMLLYPLLCCGIGLYIVSRLGGFPPPVWRDLLQSTPQLLQQGQVMEVCTMVAQSLAWLIAWGSLLLMGGIATYSALEKLFLVMSRNKLSRDMGWDTPNPYTYGEVKLARTVARSIPTQQAQEVISKASYVQSQAQAELVEKSQEQALQLDVRSLRQMGYTPYNTSTRQDKRKPRVGTNPTIQQRRLQHRIRLAHVESSKLTEPLADRFPFSIEKQEKYDADRDKPSPYDYWDDFSHMGMGHSPLQKD